MSFLVVALALALRIAWVLAVPSKPVGDFAMYVESAAHLVAHGRFDSEYVYMPGYVLLIAPVQALGGGWLATKLVGAVLGGLGTGPVMGIARRISGGSRKVALLAGWLYALWPAGIALASVTGTDMPAAVLVVTAAYLLLRFAPDRPLVAAALFGVVTGLAAYIRAIVVPLAALSLLVFRAAGQPWRRALASAGLSLLVALLVLLPWAMRNHSRYGETFFTDSHGGLTALVGANPNTDGCYSRSLNRMFRDVTGFAVLAEPHREADAVALDVAKSWTRFDPLFSLGLLASKAERLLVHERALLYWPLFRAGVLPEARRSFFARHQRGIEAVADGYWMVVAFLGLAGCGVAWMRRQWLALALLPQAFILIALYTAIFAEPRYRLPISMILMPFAAQAVWWAIDTGRQLRRRASPPGWKREAGLGVGIAAGIFVVAPLAAHTGEHLREHHRWAVHQCRVANDTRFCAWRTVASPTADAEPGLRGVWNGLGLATSSAGLIAETELALPPGDYALRLNVDTSGAPASGNLRLSNGAQPLGGELALAELPGLRAQPLAWQASFHHDGGPLRLRAGIEGTADRPGTSPGRVWLSDLRLEKTN